MKAKVLKIENFQINNYCQKVVQVADEDGDFVSVKFVSDVAIDTTFNDEKIKIPVAATTVLSDLDYMELEETIFEPNIY